MSRKTRKLIWSAPLVAVLAVAGALAMFAALGPGSVFRPTTFPARSADLNVPRARTGRQSGNDLEGPPWW